MSSADRRRPALLVLAVLAATLAATLAASLTVGALPAGAAHGAGGGYWLAGADGQVYRFGNAAELGSVGGTNLNQPVVCMTSTATGHGYWLVGRDGGVFAFGDAPYAGSTGGIPLNQPIVGMAAPSGAAAAGPGTGYWLVAADGGVFAFGTAGFFGSTGSISLNQPITSMAAHPSGKGYWLSAADGGIFAFGDARFFGAPTGRPPWAAAVGIAATASGQGYWLAGRDGAVFAYGDAPFVGAAVGATSAPVVAIAPVGRPGGCGGFEAPAPPPPEAISPERFADASRWAAGRAGTAGFTLIDTATGQARGNDEAGVALRTASIVKVIIGMRLFARAAEQRRGLTAEEQSDLAAMIRSSDNDAASRLWASLGGPAVITWVRRVTGVRNTNPPGNPASWGFTTTTARDMAVILQALVRAKGISAPARDALLREMRSVIPSQRWGIGPAVHRSNPAVKNGWYPDSDAPVWRVHCTGIADHAGRSNRWVIVVTTRYPAELGQAYGQETCSGIAARALPPDI